jgi:hypothetical protein
MRQISESAEGNVSTDPENNISPKILPKAWKEMSLQTFPKIRRELYTPAFDIHYEFAHTSREGEQNKCTREEIVASFL